MLLKRAILIFGIAIAAPPSPLPRELYEGPNGERAKEAMLQGRLAPPSAGRLAPQMEQSLAFSG